MQNHLNPETEPGLAVDRLVELYPRLYHLTAGGSWPSIERHGLRSTTQLVETSGLDWARQVQLLTQQRLVSTVIDHPICAKVIIRDQSPLRLRLLRSKLIDMTVEQWLETLNDRVFFWLHPNKLKGLLSARASRGHPHDVLTLDTRSLLGRHLEQVRLSPINSGSALYPNAALRGTSTFARLADYPYAERRQSRSLADAVVELAVIGGVADVSTHVIGVDRYLGDEFQHSVVGDARAV